MNDAMKPSAIVIDDVSSMRGMIRIMLESVGCDVIGDAKNGQLGLQLFIDTKPDLVLLDIDMPVKDGISTLKSILSYDPKATVVMMTTVSNMDVVESCLFIGAKDYITKDKQPEVINARLKEVVDEL